MILCELFQHLSEIPSAHRCFRLRRSGSAIHNFRAVRVLEGRGRIRRQLTIGRHMDTYHPIHLRYALRT